MKPIIKRLFRKRDLLKSKDLAHKQIRPMLIICGGALRGTYGAGAVCALHALGLEDVFDVVIGLSTGSGIGAYYLAGHEQTLLGTTIYYDDCTHDFVSMRPYPKADIDYLETVFRKAKKLDTGAIQRHRSQFFVGVTDWQTGEHSIINAKEANPDMITAIKASMAIAPLYRKPVLVNGRQYVDGSISRMLPIDLIEQFSPTDILVIANRPESEWVQKMTSLKVQAIKHILGIGMPERVQRAILAMNDMQEKDAQLFARLPMNKEIVFAPRNGKVNLLTTNSLELRNGAISSALETLELFGRPDLKIEFI